MVIKLLIKRIILCSALLIIISYRIFASVVSDSDGSVFITKAEFDTLKKDFNEQINQYNESIDNKIDGAIAAYLAGIKLAQQYNLDNKYKLINPTWMKNKRFNKSKKGNKYVKYMSITFATMDRTNGSEVNSGRTMFLSEWTCSNWGTVVPLTVNDSDQEYLYKVNKKTIGNLGQQYILDSLIEPTYTVSVTGGAAGSRGAIGTETDRYILGETCQFTKGSDTKFGSYYKDYQIYAYVSGAQVATGTKESVAVSWSYSDKVSTDATLLYLAGGKLNSDTMYLLDQAKASELGEQIAIASSNMGLSRQARDVSGWSIEKRTDGTQSTYPLSLSAAVYRHNYNTIASTNLMHEGITQVMSDKVYYYYNGCPLFTTSSENGTVKFKLKFTNTANAQTKWALKASEFSNEDNPQNCDNIENCSETTFLTNSGSTIDVSFDVKKDTTYWIKAEPVSGYTTLEIVGDITQIGD